MNKVFLKGNLVATPEIRVLDINGRKVSVANFTIAVTRYFKKADGSKDRDVTFVQCENWDSGADLIGKYCVKGDPLLVEGSLKVESWEKDGQKFSKMKVRVSNFDKLFRAPARENNDNPPDVVHTEDF